jgi:hypothetical protein
VSICVADVVVLPWYLSFMDAMCDLSAYNARVFKLIRRSSSPAGSTVRDGGCGIVMSRSCSLATGWFVCFAGGERRIMMSAGRLVGASGMSPIGSMTVSYAVFVRLVRVSNGRSVMVNVFVMASCSEVLEVRRHPNAWSPYWSNMVPHMHFPGWWMMGSRSLRCMSSVNGSFCNRLEGSLLGRLCSAMLVSGLRRLGRKMLMSFGSSGI